MDIHFGRIKYAEEKTTGCRFRHPLFICFFIFYISSM
jgi:hypothetical protein